MRLPWSSGEPALPATFWWLFSGQLVNALASFVFPFMALFLRDRGFSTAQAGLTVSAFGAGTLLAAPLAGTLTDRLGRRPTMLGALLASGTAAALLPALPTAAIAPGLAVLGFVSHAYRPAAAAAVADVVPPAQVARAYGLLYWANNLGFGVSLLLGGSLVFLGFGPLFLADAATTLLFAALVWRRVPETRPATSGRGGLEEAGYRAVLGDGVFLGFLGLQICAVVVIFQFMVAVPIDLVSRGVSAAAYGRIMAVNGLLIALLQPAASRLFAARDPSWVLAAGALLLGAGFGSYPFCTSGWGFAAATAVWTLGEILTFPTAAALVANLSPPELRGRYQGAYSLSFGASMLASPILGSLALERLGSRGLWLSCAAVAAAVAGANLAAAPGRRQRTAIRPA